MSPGTSAEPDVEEQVSVVVVLDVLDGPCSSSAVFGPPGAQPKLRGSDHP